MPFTIERSFVNLRFSVAYFAVYFNVHIVYLFPFSSIHYAHFIFLFLSR